MRGCAGIEEGVRYRGRCSALMNLYMTIRRSTIRMYISNALPRGLPGNPPNTGSWWVKRGPARVLPPFVAAPIQSTPRQALPASGAHPRAPRGRPLNQVQELAGRSGELSKSRRHEASCTRDEDCSSARRGTPGPAMAVVAILEAMIATRPCPAGSAIASRPSLGGSRDWIIPIALTRKGFSSMSSRCVNPVAWESARSFS